MGASVSTKNLGKLFGTLQVIDNWTLDIAPGERVVILGPSGSGKTTFLRIIAGLDAPASGSVNVSSNRVGFVFQEPRLIPWRSVEQNLNFVNQGSDVNDILQRLKLNGFEDYRPAQLSGGMQQRVNLARALIVDPLLLILDEAFGSLDLPVKLAIMQDMLEQWKEKRFTLVAVTHDLKEALYMADRIIIVSNRPSRIIHQFHVKLGEENRNFSDPQLLHMESELMSMICAAGPAKGRA